MDEPKFSTFDVVKKFDIKIDRLKDWINRGYISPTVRAKGAGSKSLFSANDLCEIFMFKCLIDFGFNRKKASELVGLMCDLVIEVDFENQPRPFYTTTDIKNAFGITRGRLKDWMEFGYVHPTIPAEGAGTKAYFSVNDFCILYLFKYLIDFGFKREKASELANLVKAYQH